MTIAICEDNIECANQIKHLISSYFKSKNLEIPKIKEYHDGESLLSDNVDLDILFLDIELPGISGICVGREIKSVNRNTIIFVVTSFMEYIDDAMRFNVFRYIMKPIDTDGFYRNLSDALYRYSNDIKKYIVETHDTAYTLYSTDIIMVEVTGHKVSVQGVNGIYHSVKPMKYWQELLLTEPMFYQSHRSYIVNFHHISSYTDDSIGLYKDSCTAFLTKRKRVDFKNKYLMYLENTR
jgi:two-component system LytT family response regulator